jgi:hypothetical protein
MQNKKILALDVSTTCIGAAVIDINGKIDLITHVAPKIDKNIKGIEALCLKKIIFEEQFLLKYNSLSISDVVIEEPLLSSNNVNTCGTLLRFNGMISDSVYRILGVVPEYISSLDARKYAFPELLSIRTNNKQGEKYPADKLLKDIKNNHLVMFGSFNFDIDKKIIIKDLIDQRYPDIQWLYNKKNELIKENYDMSDALAAGIAYTNKLKFDEMEPEIVKSEHDKNEKTILYTTRIWDKTYDKIIRY